MNGSNQTTCIVGKNYRITILTPRLIRMEYDPEGRFEDRPTQMAQDRHFAPVPYHYWKTEKGIEIRTAGVNLFYDERPFSAAGLWAENRSACRGIYTTWHFGDPVTENLGGTARTLDEADGETPLCPGILSRLCGYSVLDDSHSPVLLENGWYEPRRDHIFDLYLFCYGTDYRQALKDYFHLCGTTPLLPRCALGNWWSRFYAYTDHEYLALMDTFRQKGIPLSVAVLDMNWHITDAGPEGRGWTGYTWDHALIGDPGAFLEQLHQRGLKVTLNLHPAEGIQAHEERYPAVARVLGKDAEHRQRIPFDPTDRQFMNAYFQDVLAPLERQGVDFWWVDWQQGTKSAAPGVDPLWVLNHFHALHSVKNGHRPFILSRYCGPGSHRYPVGFSGDSAISWASLAFQPYFTSTASNIGYGWWSHDIGGHTHGKRDPELQVRWLQYGVFSPIMRMHSTSNRFNGKEPWRYSAECERIMTDLLRLRHRMIPYLYTMNWRCHTQGEMLVQPMYYAYPEREEAYQVPNQYLFGSELMVMPITSPQISDLELGSVAGWLPEGTYYDFFSGLRYQGDRMIRVFRPLDQIPVFAKAGAIVVMEEDHPIQNGGMNPDALEIRVFAGADGRFDLYEDAGDGFSYQQGDYCITQMRFQWNQGQNSAFTLSPGAADAAYMPAQRSYHFRFVGLDDGVVPAVKIDGTAVSCPIQYLDSEYTWDIQLLSVPQDRAVEVAFAGRAAPAQNHALGWQEQILNRAHIQYELKDRIYHLLVSGKSAPAVFSTLHAMGLSVDLIAALMEPTAI